LLFLGGCWGVLRTLRLGGNIYTYSTTNQYDENLELSNSLQCTLSECDMQAFLTPGHGVKKRCQIVEGVLRVLRQYQNIFNIETVCDENLELIHCNVHSPGKILTRSECDIQTF